MTAQSAPSTRKPTMKLVAEKPAPTANPLEQYVLLAKSAKGAAAVELIKQVLEVPGVYVFGELLDMPHIVELATGPHAKYYNLLNLFAYGKYSDYKARFVLCSTTTRMFAIVFQISYLLHAITSVPTLLFDKIDTDLVISNKSTLPELTGPQLQKLRHLTIVSLATKTKCIPYSTLLKELDMKNLRELEDLIIEVIYADILHGKLDQKHSQLEVDYALGRDIRPEDINTIVTVLSEWCDSCEAILTNVESQINKANVTKDSRNKHKTVMEQEVTNIKKTLKTQAQDVEEQMVTDTREVGAQPEKTTKKQPKTKGKPQFILNKNMEWVNRLPNRVTKDAL